MLTLWRHEDAEACRFEGRDSARARRSHPRSWCLDPRRLLNVAAQGVGESHLPWGPALGLEEAWARNEDAGATGPRGRDVQAVQAVKELHPTRGLLGRRRRHRVDHDGGLLPLKFVDRADTDATWP